MPSPSEPIAPEPDDKDWTWVLERPCPQCGWTAGDPMLVADWLRGTIPRWRAVLARADVAERPEPQVWSALEYACHVRDVCALFGVRVLSMLQQHDPAFANWDQHATALDDRYWEQDPATVAEQYAVEAERTAAIFDTVSGDAWQRPGTRSNGSRFTVASLVNYFQHDIAHHLHDVDG